MKLLVVIPFSFYSPSGSSHNAFFRVKAIASLGHKIDVVTYPYGKAVQIDGVRLFRPKLRPFKYYTPGEYRKKCLLDPLIAVLAVRQHLRNRYDLVIAHGSVSWLLCPVFLLLKTPLIANWHGNIHVELEKWNISKLRIVSLISRRIEARIASCFSSVVCVHRSVYNLLRANGAKARKIVLIPNAVEPLPMSTVDKKSESFIILYTGTFVQVQNIDLILQAARQLVERKVEFWLLGAEEHEAAEYGRRTDIPRNVRVFEKVDRQEITSYYEQADVVISPRTFGHDTPMKLFDYLANGLCIMATNCPIHHELLDGDVAFLFEPDALSLAKGVVTLMGDQHLRHSLGSKARIRFAERYSIEKMKCSYRDLFAQFGG